MKKVTLNDLALMNTIRDLIKLKRIKRVSKKTLVILDLE
jgi:hypothetical protein